MRPGGHSKSLLVGPIRLYDPEVAAALESIEAAAALQHLYFLGLDSRDGWVPMPSRRLAGELGCDHAERALELLSECGLVEANASRKPFRYRVVPAAVLELLPHRKLTAKAISHPQVGTEGLSHSGTRIDSDPSRGAESSLAGARARAEESREEKIREDETSTSSSLRSSDVDVDEDAEGGRSREPAAGGQEKDPEQQPAPAESETPEPQDEPEDNGSDEEVDIGPAFDALRERMRWK